MVSIPHPDTRVVPNVYLRRGFNENDPTPAAMRASPNLRRTALILSPFRAGAKPANLRWPDCAPLYWRLVSDVSELVPDSVLTIVDGTRRFSSRDEWLAEERKTLVDPDDDPEAPARCVWNGPGGAPLVDARTEYWHCAGGPAPYSDSWTISFYSATPALDEAVRDAILRRCAEVGLPIVDDKLEDDHPVPLRRPLKPHLPILFAVVLFFLTFVFVQFRRSAVVRSQAFEEWKTVSVLSHEGRYREAWERLHPELQMRKPYADFAAGFTNDWFQLNAFHTGSDVRRHPAIPSRFKHSDKGRQLQFFVWKRRLWKPRWIPEWDDDETDGCMIPEITMKKDGDIWKVADWCTHCR